MKIHIKKLAFILLVSLIINHRGIAQENINNWSDQALIPAKVGFVLGGDGDILNDDLSSASFWGLTYLIDVKISKFTKYQEYPVNAKMYSFLRSLSLNLQGRFVYGFTPYDENENVANPSAFGDYFMGSIIPKLRIGIAEKVFFYVGYGPGIFIINDTVIEPGVLGVSPGKYEDLSEYGTSLEYGTEAVIDSNGIISIFVAYTANSSDNHSSSFGSVGVGFIF